MNNGQSPITGGGLIPWLPIMGTSFSFFQCVAYKWKSWFLFCLTKVVWAAFFSAENWKNWKWLWRSLLCQNCHAALSRHIPPLTVLLSHLCCFSHWRAQHAPIRWYLIFGNIVNPCKIICKMNLYQMYSRSACRKQDQSELLDSLLFLSLVQCISSTSWLCFSTSNKGKNLHPGWVIRGKDGFKLPQE